VVTGRVKILIPGGTGSGKTTLLNIRSAHIPHDERVVTTDDAAELPPPHLVRLESRSPNIEGPGESIEARVVCLLVRA
jgi:pilus assembly protein CpaF